MLKSKTTRLVLLSILLTSCSSVSGMFEKKQEAPLEGKRLSVLELQKSLTPDGVIAEGEKLSLPEAWVNSSWPQAGGYPNHSMQNLSLSSGNIKRVWTADIGSGSSDELPLTAQPVVARNMVFTLDTSSRLSAFNVQNGRKVWDIDVEKDDEDDSVVAGGVSFAHGALYVTNGYDEILAVSPDNGEILWRKRLPAPSRAAPTVIGGRVFVSTIDSRLVTLDAKDGTGLWEYTGIGEATGLIGAASPAASNDIVVPAFSSGEITALHIENGSVAWSDNLSSVRRYGGGLESLSDIKAMPVMDKGLILAVSFGGKMAAIDERTGSRVWQREISGSETPWISGTTVFVLSNESQLIALNLANGSILWITELERFEDGDKDDPIHWTGPVMASSTLMVTGSHGELVQVDAHNGNILKSYRTKKNVQIPPVIANSTLFLLSEDGTLMAYQ